MKLLLRNLILKSGSYAVMIALCFVAFQASAQDASLVAPQSVVYDENTNEPIPGVSIVFLDKSSGTTTDGQGRFELPLSAKGEQIIVKAIGFATDTFVYAPEMAIYLKTTTALDDVVIEHRFKSTEIDMLDSRKTEKIGARELMKAACCNLSESFETTPSVDVGFTDAISGYKQIQMLGLAGTHTSFTRENIPDVRGLAAITGLTFTPGTWVNSMQLSKGAGSVVNGYEGTAGQINVEWHKPFIESEPRLLLNGYQSSHGRSEGNAVFNHDFKNGLSTNVLLHGRGDWARNDQNQDGFLDQPLGEVFAAANRWFYFGENGWEFQGGVKGVYVNQFGGMADFKGHKETNPMSWGYTQNIQRMEAWAKIGKVSLNKPWRSTGLQLAGTWHDQESTFGSRSYNGEQESFYANYIFQSIIANTNHIIKGGASFIYDRYDEQFLQDPYLRTEYVPGIFMEYSYNYLEKLNVVAGLRADHHNQFGGFVTPRLHVRYAPVENSVFRASAGRAQRTANVFSENSAYLASNRRFVLEGYSGGKYGYSPEVAWNMGLNFTQKFIFNYRDGAFGMDYYYTDFRNQVVTDIENPGEVRFYNLEGRSFAHSFQAQLDYEPVRKFDLRLAYRYYDVKTAYRSGLKEKPLVAAHRAFLNMAYETNNQWKFDYTLHWSGQKRIPLHYLDGSAREGVSPSFVQMNAQLSKGWVKSRYELYAGVENITNYMQPNLIINAENPFNPFFDAALIWGPAMGRNLYAGFRLKL